MSAALGLYYGALPADVPGLPTSYGNPLVRKPFGGGTITFAKYAVYDQSAYSSEGKKSPHTAETRVELVIVKEQ